MGIHFPSDLWKVSFSSDKLLTSYYLFIFSSHQHVHQMTSQILLILIDFLATFDLKLLCVKPL